MEWLNTVLIKSEQIIQSQDTKSFEIPKARDAFGHEYSDLNEPMPEVKLAGKVGGVKLRSMFHAHACQYRYGLIGDASYPICKENRVKIQSALEWLKDPDKEGKTWGMADMEEILFAYPSRIPEVPVRFASLAAALQKSAGLENVNAEKFENIAKEVITTLKSLPPGKEIKNVQLFAIRKMDKARSKIVYFRNYSTEWLIKSAEEWIKGGVNIPKISFRVWAVKTDNESASKPEYTRPEIPLPLQVAKIINKVWKMDGSSAGEIKKLKLYQGLDLLLEQDKQNLSEYMLSVLIRNTFGLILFLGNLLHFGLVIKDRFQSENYQFLPSTIGLLLYKQNRTKEEYMESVPYLIGQMLKISDELHAFYCKVVRKGEVPPQLAGNSIMVSALETPGRALSILCPRINPYIAWAKQYRTKNVTENGKESWRAGWYLNLYEQNASLLKEHLPVLENIRFKDHEKAELFIGYLADFPKKDEVANKADNKIGG
jgi:hypothetical protein